MEEAANIGTSVQYRLSATLLTGKKRDAALVAVSELGLDRVADAKGQIRLLLWPEEVPLLLARGFELHLHRAIPVAPLPPKLIRRDQEVRATVERRLRGMLKGRA